MYDPVNSHVAGFPTFAQVETLTKALDASPPANPPESQKPRALNESIAREIGERNKQAAPYAR